MEKDISTEITKDEGGRIIFAPDVIATIASLAASEVEGVVGLAGGVMEELTGKLGKKSYTKGIKVDTSEEGTTAEITLIVKYGYRIQDVSRQVQESVKNAIETMTGLSVIAVNIFVQSIAFDKPAKPEKAEAVEEEKPAEK